MRIKKIAPVTPANGLLENTYGTSQENGYTQEYINNLNTITNGTGTINSNYIGNTERNNYYKNGNLVCFVCTCTANATWTGQAEIISNLPKPIRNFNFIGFNANQALPVRFELTTNGVLRKFFSNNGVVSSDVVDLYITYFTTD